MEAWPSIEVPDYIIRPGFKAVVTVTLGELIEGGWVDWDDPDWAWGPLKETSAPQEDIAKAQMLCQAFNDRYYYNEISMVPPKVWRKQLLYKMDSLWRKYKPLFGMEVNPFAESDKYGKSRDTYSDFPQTQLSGSEDYASSGHDREYEDIVIGDVLSRIKDFYKNYQAVEDMFLTELEPFFSCLYSVSLNTF